ncbi:Protein of unknown function [Paenibacillus sp. 1_12]|uniref:DUF2812 domain-containing protein n=1 Tax=Paenibacillus sp. 1_12 TaxID=1566278 RepID=UPI0008F4021B|nr:DUF2812 domain-containing protein [Paenibacillus sp. 1_12]SFK82883.1 Protein of unknown function [Paenibacillus sp. 1_12]
MRIFKFFINFDKEEQWLNEMAKQGYIFTKKSIRYEFQPAIPDHAPIKMDYRKFKNKRDFEDYCTLFEDSGWKHVVGTKSSGAQYFKKIAVNGSDDIFSDVDSKAARYKRISDIWMSTATTFITLFAVLISTHSIDVKAFLNPKLLYVTPGLWDKSGEIFWKAFLFETPFAFVRGFIWMVIPIMIAICFSIGSKANKLFKKTQEDKYKV